MDVFGRYQNLTQFLTTELQISSCQQPTKSYILNTLANPKYNLANRSITLLYAEARDSHKFHNFQTLADWLLFARSVFPNSLTAADAEYYDVIAQNCYYTCYRLIERKWVIFEELADIFPAIVQEINENLSDIRFVNHSILDRSFS